MGKGPGKYFRNGMTLIELFDKFPDDETAERWFVSIRWPDGICCAHCGSARITERSKHPTMPYHCKDCRRFFSVKTGTVMQSSKLGYRKWVLAIYLMMTSVKGTSSMKLHRDIGVTQKTAWHLGHRIRETWTDSNELFSGPVEVDESYYGGKERNKHADKKIRAGRGYVGKVPVVGMKDRETNMIRAEVIPSNDRHTLHEFICRHVRYRTKVYTDDWSAYRNLPGLDHSYVKHMKGEYVSGDVHTNGIESFWAMLKRGYYGTYHHISPKHLDRYVDEFSGRHNVRQEDTSDQMETVVSGFDGKRLRYKDLVEGE